MANETWTPVPRTPETWTPELPPPPPPRNTVAPVATGSGVVGQTLTTTLGTWANDPTSFEVQWLRDGVEIAGATSQSYQLQAADSETSVRARITATGSGSTAALSNVIAVARLFVASLDFSDPRNSGYWVAI